MFLGQVKSVHVPLSRGTASKALKWALIIFTGSSLIDVTRGWTYHYSQEVMNWTQTRQWCQTHYTDMVAIQSQEENDYLVSILPNRTRSPYYWIGITRTHANETWTWVGHNSTWIGSKSWAQDEPNNDHTTEFCVEIYINYGANRGRWNDEKCANKKYPVCYQAQCTNASCERGKCTETINKTRCDCEPGFEGDRCQAAVACKEPIKPLYGDMRCSGRHGDHNFESTCSFLCEEGFMLSGPSVLSCNSSGLICLIPDLRGGRGVQAWMYNYSTNPARDWNTARHWCQEHFTDMVAIQNHREMEYLNQMLPLFQSIVQCTDQITAPSGGFMDCSHPIAPNSYNSSCEVECDDGYELNGQKQISCDSAGQWTASVPTCKVKGCPRLSSPSMGNMTCVDPLKPFSFNSSCHFTCEEGHSLMGNSTLHCLASGQWSKQTPVCKVIRCSSLKAPPRASMQCQDPLGVFSYGSTCTTQCEDGFDLSGDNSTQCLSQGNWSHALPLCQARPCPLLDIGPHHGWMNCSHPYSPFSHDSHCDFGCHKGFMLKGTPAIHCNTSGLWSQESPSCQAVQCPRLSSPSMGNMTCVDPLKPFSFNSSCHFTCDEGHSLMGNSTLHCLASGQWSKQTPVCKVIRCNSLKAPPHASMQCQDPLGEFSYGSTCTTQCEEGFDLSGDNSTQCLSQGNWSWSHALPLCQAHPCPLLATGPHHGWMNCSHPHSPFSHGSHCDFGCNEGFLLRGTPAIHCNTSGLWSQKSPSCQAVRCPRLSSPSMGNMTCVDPLKSFSFNSSCHFTCDEGHSLMGNSTLHCLASGQWSKQTPVCTARPCPLLAIGPHHGWMNCSHPHNPFSHGSHCDFGCNEGFLLRGTPAIHCNASGLWSQESPICQVVLCEAFPTQSSPMFMNCSHPLGNFGFGSQCLFTCDDGFSMNGTGVLSCSSTGQWNNSLPTCTEEGDPLGRSMLIYTGVGAGSAVAALALIGLGLLIAKRFSKKKSLMDFNDSSLWEERVNPAFES